MSDKIPDSSNIIVQDNLIHTLNGLDRVQKERLILMFREASLRGFDIKGIPVYIKTQLGLDISVKLVLKLRRLVTIEDRKWYITYAKDQYAYIGVYRKCIDELDSLRKECWRLVMMKETRDENKIAAMREIHNIVKTQVLLLRDLPFVMDLSRYYDPNIIDINQKPKPIQKLGSNNNNDKDKETKEHPLNSHLHKVIFDAVNNQNLKDLPASLPHKVLAEAEGKRKEIFKNIDDDIMDDMTNQVAGMTESEKEKYDSLEKQKKEAEDDKMRNVISQFEDSLRAEFKNSGKLSLEKVEEIQESAQGSMDYLSAITTEKERNTIKKLREIRDD